MRMVVRWIAVSGLVLLHSGCDTPFDPSYLLNSFRVLAIRAEPPSIVSEGSTTLDALIYQPNDEPVEYQWSWCPLRGDAALGYECVLTENGFEDMLYPDYDDEVVTPINFGLGNSATAVFEFPAPIERMAALCPSEEGEEEDPSPIFACPRGQLVFSVRLVARSGGEEVTALSQVTLLLTPTAVINANPSIDEVLVAQDDDGEGIDVATEEQLADDYSLSPGSTYRVRADVPPTAAESFAFVQPGGDAEVEPELTTESLAISWFIEGGDLIASRTRFVPDDTEFEAALVNTWTLPGAWELTGDTMRLFVVVRDNRGGVGWAEQQFVLEAEQP